MPNFEYENMFDGNVCGVDEVGRGPLAGPVIACALIFNNQNIPQDLMLSLDDSKKISKKKRQDISKKLQPYCKYAIGSATVEEIDEINILQATLIAMKRAILNLNIDINTALIDDNKSPNIDINCKTIIKGDSKSLSIAGASIIAKVHRDDIMNQYSKKYPVYHWEQNAGYGTKKHLIAIQEHGITPHHRKSFAPIKQYLTVK